MTHINIHKRGVGMNRFKSITTKVLVISLVTTVVLTVVLISMSNNLTEKALEKMIDNNANKDVELYSQYIGDWFQERLNEISTYSYEPVVKSMEWDQMEIYLKKEMDRKSHIYSFIFIANKEGDYNTTLKRNAGNLKHRQYFDKIMQGESFVSNPIISNSTGEYICAILAPIKGAKGEVIGVIGGAIKLENLYRFIKDLKVDVEGSYAYIIDKNGVIIAHPNKTMILDDKLIDKLNIVDEISSKSLDDVFREKDRGVVRYKFKDGYSYGYFNTIPNTDGWKIVTKIPVSYLVSPIEKISRELLVIAIIGIILSGLLSIFMTKTISDPIVKLKNAIVEATNGNLLIKTEISSKDEIGVLGKKFNEMMEVISKLTYHDLLTGLSSRKVFEEQMELALAHSKRNQENLATMIIGIDKFKNINDAFGLSAGDELLKKIAQRIKTNIREEDGLCRITGDEFAVYFPEIENEKQVIRFAEKIINDIKMPFYIGENKIYISASAGLSFYLKDGTSKGGLLKNAKIALRRAKEKGGGTYQLYTPMMKEELLEQMELEKMLVEALDKNEFKIFYQPIIDIEDLSIIGMEALLRWDHPTLGRISPAKFIPIAEENGFIVKLGEWVLRKACEQNIKWQKSGLKKIFVAVNISLRQFHSKNFVNKVRGILEETGIDPQYLGLEITESIAMENEDYTIKILKELKDMGIYISMDDFGTGYSSLSYLNKFPIDTLKIDKSFINDIVDAKGNNCPIASTIIAMGHNLNLRITAEGVETVEQLSYLKNQKCDTIQGYLFSKPVNSEEFEKLLVGPNLDIQVNYSQ